MTGIAACDSDRTVEFGGGPRQSAYDHRQATAAMLPGARLRAPPRMPDRHLHALPRRCAARATVGVRPTLAMRMDWPNGRIVFNKNASQRIKFE
jgi:hypothetical protein